MGTSGSNTHWHKRRQLSFLAIKQVVRAGFVCSVCLPIFWAATICVFVIWLVVRHLVDRWSLIAIDNCIVMETRRCVLSPARSLLRVVYHHSSPGLRMLCPVTLGWKQVSVSLKSPTSINYNPTRLVHLLIKIYTPFTIYDGMMPYTGTGHHYTTMCTHPLLVNIKKG